MLEFPDVRRRACLLELDGALREARRTASSVGLLLIDITNLRRINQLHGYAVGDIALAVVLERLQGTSTEDNNVFRTGSHHFAFLLPALANTGLIALAANRLRAVLVEPIEAGEAHVTLDVSIGVATAGGEENSAAGLLGLAETALRNARDGIGFEFLETEQESIDRAQSRMLLEQDFTETLNANAFELFYQPKVDLKTGAVPACEALLRWPRPDGSYLPPAFAVELADTLNLGYPLTKWIMGEAIRQSRAWHDRFGINIAVNVEATLIDNPDLYNLVADTLSIWSADRALVSIEVTESAVISDKASGFDNLRRLRELGIDLAIDDFGTGYSSLSYFKDIPAQELKIDRSFVTTINDDPQNRALVDIIVQIAHLFGMKVVGEGVENQACLDHLIASGCDFAQGFLYSRPLPAREFEQWLEQYTRGAHAEAGA